MIDLADAEAAHLGNVANTCIRRGAIPPVSLRPLWFTNRGKCIGLRIIGHDEDEFDLDGNHTGPDYLDPLRPIVQHLKAYAGEVVEAEGVGWLLYEWETVRDVYYEMYPLEDSRREPQNAGQEWVTIEEAMSALGRSKSTVYSWARKGWCRKIEQEDMPTLFNLFDLISLKANIKSGRPAGI